MKRNSGFTLIELLIVVAIIAILALIAVPNFLEAQTRSKVARAKNDMRTLRVALEAYRLDNTQYPRDIRGTGTWTTWYQLTTPIAYLTSVPHSPWRTWEYIHAGYNDPGMPPYDYAQYEDLQDETWTPRLHAAGLLYTVVCSGPDEDNDLGWDQVDYIVVYPARRPSALGYLYDPTNGSVSSGDIIMTNRGFPN